MKLSSYIILICFQLIFFGCQNKKKQEIANQQNYLFDDASLQAASSRPSYYQKRFYEPKYPFTLETYVNHEVDFQKFLADHHHSSRLRPLIGVVTQNKEDILPVHQLLVKIKQTIKDKNQLTLITDEILAKVVAYRNLEKGRKIPVPFVSKKGKIKLALYKVDTVFNLMGMPAFGLLPNKKKAPPIILFRGTDLSLSMQGYSSILADLDLNGPGVLAFYAGQDEMHAWLAKNTKKFVKARALGYSLGGALVQYLAIIEKDYLSQDVRFPSVAFNQPGVSADFIEKWNRLSLDQRPHLRGYIVEGDIVSSVGKLIGDVKALTLDQPLEPLKAHVTLMSLQQRLYAYSLDVSLKNELDFSSQDEQIKSLFESFSKQTR
jgi:hypothetical protein